MPNTFGIAFTADATVIKAKDIPKKAKRGPVSSAQGQDQDTNIEPRQEEDK